MALIACTECTREISDRAAACPHCGAPIVLPPERRGEPARTTSTVGAGVKIGFGMFVILPMILFFGGCFVVMMLAAIGSQ